jgi:hypothetical protein
MKMKRKNDIRRNLRYKRFFSFNYSKLNSKKAQMEIIGLMIIVILITLAMLFMVKFGMDKDNYEKTYTSELLVSSTIGAVTKTTTDLDDGCGQLSFEKDLLDDCASNMGEPNFMYAHICDGENSCDYLEDRVSRILEGTLGDWNKRYEFKVFVETKPDPLISIINLGGCPKRFGGDIDRADQNLKTTVGLATIYMKICG